MIEIYSYNLNGIRSAINKGFFDWFKGVMPDIICLQEVRATPDQFNSSFFNDLGYYCIWYPAKKSGYSGTAMISKKKPINYRLGIGEKKFDEEGRVITAFFDNYTLLCVYVPSGTTGDIRQSFKMEFLSCFYDYVKNLIKSEKHLIISGDFNICHKPIDINNPEKHENVSGFLPEEREWFDNFVNLGLIDTFRVFNKEPNNYTWWSYRQKAREKNLGWRIDYHLINENSLNNLVDAKIINTTYHSDHVPIYVKMNF